MKILVFGSLNFDHVYETPHFVAPQETLAAKSYNRNFGGKGFNQAVALARAGMEVYMAGRIGIDGQPFVKFLKNENINTDYLEVTDATATGHAIIELSGGQNRILLFGGANQAITTKQIDETLAGFSPADWLVIQNEINNMPYLITAAKQRGLHILFNAAPMDNLVATYPLELIDIICINEIEGAALAGTSGSPREIIAALDSRFPGQKILLTAGSTGSYFLANGHIDFCPAKEVNIVDTTAAGDTFSGFFLTAILQGQSEISALKTATSAAAIAIQRPGAAASIPTMQEVLANG